MPALVDTEASRALTPKGRHGNYGGSNGPQGGSAASQGWQGGRRNAAGSDQF